MAASVTRPRGVETFGTARCRSRPAPVLSPRMFATFFVVKCRYAQDIGPRQKAARDLPQNGGQTIVGGSGAARTEISCGRRVERGTEDFTSGDASSSGGRGEGLLRAIRSGGALAATDRSRRARRLRALRRNGGDRWTGA